jgi:hypothetical protein
MTQKRKPSPRAARLAKARRRRATTPSTSTEAVVAAQQANPSSHAELPVAVPTAFPEHADDPDVPARMRELEERLDRMIDAHSRERGGSHGPLLVPRPAPPPSLPAPPPDGVLDTARELLSADFYLRKWGRIGLRNRSQEVDDFGYDPVYEQKVLPFFVFLYERYFRVEVHGLENVPNEGRCLLVANHSGTIPFDGIMLRLAVRREHPLHRDVRWLAEDVIFHFPFLGSFTARVGAVRACQENAERLLRHEAIVAVFPEGMKGIG